VTPDPTDETDEVWDDLRVLALLAAVAYVAGLAALGLLVRRLVRRLNKMATAFDRLEGGDYAARIGPVAIPEVNSLAERFDRLARALEAAFAEKDALNRSLLDVQDAERKAIALELHDEYGPCLFGLRVEARAILAAAEARRDEGIAERGRAIIGIVGEIQRANRALLDRLRPMALNELPLPQVLDELVGGMIAIGGDIEWTVAVSDALSRYDETSELTIYRVVQEAITNALRHAQAGTIGVVVELVPGRPDVVEIVVEDDGRGRTARREGMGLKGMRERTAAVGGTLTISDRPGGGTRLRATVPVVPAAASTVGSEVAT
jgi:two-component system, NarL family, sensor histidine kinase UhpB